MLLHAAANRSPLIPFFLKYLLKEEMEMVLFRFDFIWVLFGICRRGHV